MTRRWVLEIWNKKCMLNSELTEDEWRIKDLNMKFSFGKNLICYSLISLLTILSTSNNCMAYGGGTHIHISSEAMYLSSNPDLENSTYSSKIRAGSYEADAKFFDGTEWREKFWDLAYRDHFWDPDTGDALSECNPWCDTAYTKAEEYWGYAIKKYNDNTNENGKNEAYTFLGHIAHLLADMAVPAHVLNDAHPPWNPDSYETYMGESDHYSAWDRDDVSLPIRSANQLKDLFYDLAQHTQYFPSDGEDGNSHGQFDDELDFEGWPDDPNSMREFSFPLPGEEIWYISDDNIQEEIAPKLIPLAIEYTASLYNLFYAQFNSHVSVSDGIDIISPFIIGDHLSISFELLETNGVSIEFEQVAIAILDGSDNFLFDFAIYNNITLGQRESLRKTTSKDIGDLLQAGTYKAVIRGKLPGGDWFDFDVTGAGVNPQWFSATNSGPGSWVSVSNGVSVSPSTVTLGEDFTVTFSLKERFGDPTVFEQIAVEILRDDGEYVFDFAVWNNITIPAYGTCTQSVANNLNDTRLEGVYKAVIRGKTEGSNRFNFDTIDYAQNPASFLATYDGGGANPDLIVRDLYLTDHKTFFSPGEDFQVYTWVKNIGDGDVDPSQTVRIEYLLSTGKTIDSNPDSIGYDDIDGSELTAGQGGGRDFHFDTPDEMGTYNITVDADTENVVIEDHESNNKYNPPLVLMVDSPDRSTLTDLYNICSDLQVDSSYTTNWGADEPVNTWYGVELHPDDYRVKKLILHLTATNDHIYAYLSKLPRLEELELVGTNIMSVKIGDLINLKKLSITVSSLPALNIPGEIYGLTNLMDLRLRGFITGTISPAIENLGVLEYLKISGYEPDPITGEFDPITGELPVELFSLSNLVHLDLNHNEFEGLIPHQIGNLTLLKYLNLSENRLSGELPEELFSLSNLEYLILGSHSVVYYTLGPPPCNILEGTIPPQIGSLSNLKYLDLSNNRFSGELPEELYTLTKLEYLYLINNSFSGPISAQIGNLNKLSDLWLFCNSFSGELPEELFTLYSLESLRLGVQGFFGRFKNNFFNGQVSPQIQNLSNLKILDLSMNDFSGELPEELYTLTKLEYLYLSNNNFEGTLSPQIGTLINLWALNLAANDFSGALPSEINNLTNLYRLDLGYNNFSGAVPPEICNLTNLDRLFLGENNFNQIPPGLTEGRSYVYVYNNHLTFESIEPNIGNSCSFDYSNQAVIPVPENHIWVPVGETLSLSVDVGGEHNQYQWFGGGQDSFFNPISSLSSDPSFIKSDFTAEDYGTYVCHITNTTVTDLTLYSEEIIVDGAIIKGTIFESDGITPFFGSTVWIEAYAAGPCNFDWAKEAYYANINIGDNGTFTINNLPPGTYYLSAHTDDNCFQEWWTSSASVRDCMSAGTISVAEFEEVTGINFQLDPGASSISGIVYDAIDHSSLVWIGIEVYLYSDNPCNETLVAYGSYTNSYMDVNNNWIDGTYTVNGLEAGNYTLRAVDDEGNYLSAYWASSDSVAYCQSAGIITVGEGEEVTGKDFYLRRHATISGTMYVTNSGDNSVSQANLVGSDIVHLGTLNGTLNSPHGIAIDEAAGKMFVVNIGNNTVSQANLDGSGGISLGDLNGTLNFPLGIAIDEAAGKMYVTNYGNDTVTQANLDGSGGVSLGNLNGTLYEPVGIAIDEAAGKIYVTNDGNNTVTQANLDGSGGVSLGNLNGTLYEPTGIAIDKAAGKMYVLNDNSNSITYANLDGSFGIPLRAFSTVGLAPWAFYTEGIAIIGSVEDCSFWRDDFDGAIPDLTWVELANIGTNNSALFQNNRYEFHVENPGGIEAQLFSGISGPTFADGSFQSTVQQIAPSDTFIASICLRGDPVTGDGYYFFVTNSTIGIGRQFGGELPLLLASQPLAIDWTDFQFKCEVIGSNLYVKAWPTDEPEPDSWAVTATDSYFGSGGCAIGLTASPNTVNQVAFDDVFLRTGSIDMCTDTDDDGIPDTLESSGYTDPNDSDTDGDGIQDGTEIGLTLAHIGPDTDTGLFQPDLDNTTTTYPLQPDSDYDGLTDGQEDANANGMIDAGERDPNNRDYSFNTNSATFTNPFMTTGVNIIGKRSEYAGFGTWDGYGHYIETVGTEVVDSVECLKILVRGNGNDPDPDIDPEWYYEWLAEDTDQCIWMLQVYNGMSDTTSTFGAADACLTLPADPVVGQVFFDYDKEIINTSASVPQLGTGAGPFFNCLEIKVSDHYPFVEGERTEYYAPGNWVVKIEKNVGANGWELKLRGDINGDITGDGNIDLPDAILALQIVAGIIPSQNIYLAADVNGDNKIGIEEAVYILEKVVGIRE
ncbi:MAG: zinc dependent phospholipase C family protein [Desulfobacteraceae bacterium]|nr:zinc dependent phospholipase C family protein [Desulfobacteraceae bacterium]